MAAHLVEDLASPGDRTNWIPNSKSKSCHKCDKEFGFFQRRHHCRKCFLVFCKHCTVKSNFYTETIAGGKKAAGKRGAGKSREETARLCKNCESQCNLLKQEMTIQHDLNKRYFLQEQNRLRQGQEDIHSQFSENQSLASEKDLELIQRRGTVRTSRGAPVTINATLDSHTQNTLEQIGIHISSKEITKVDNSLEFPRNKSAISEEQASSDQEEEEELRLDKYLSQGGQELSEVPPVTTSNEGGSEPRDRKAESFARWRKLKEQSRTHINQMIETMIA